MLRQPASHVAGSSHGAASEADLPIHQDQVCPHLRSSLSIRPPDPPPEDCARPSLLARAQRVLSTAMDGGGLERVRSLIDSPPPR